LAITDISPGNVYVVVSLHGSIYCQQGGIGQKGMKEENNIKEKAWGI